MDILVSIHGTGDKMKSGMLMFLSLFSTKNCNVFLATEKCLANTSGSGPILLIGKGKEGVNCHRELEELVSAF